jgi:hypothetical protein
MLSGICGRTSALFITQRYGRSSFLVLMLLIALCISLGMLIYETVDKELDFSFHSIC